MFSDIQELIICNDDVTLSITHNSMGVQFYIQLCKCTIYIYRCECTILHVTGKLYSAVLFYTVTRQSYI